MGFPNKKGSRGGGLYKKPKKAKISNTSPTPAGISGDAIIPSNILPSLAATTTAATSGDSSPTTLTTLVTRKAPPSSSTSTDLEAQVGTDDENINTRDLACLDKAKLKRMTIAYIYSEYFNSAPKTGWGKIENWEGKDGVVAGIINMFPSKERLEPNTTEYRSLADIVTRVLVNVNICEDEGKIYEGKINYSGGPNILIGLDSVEAQIICDSLGSGVSLRWTKLIVNNYRLDNDLPLFGMNPILSCYSRMKPRVLSMLKKPQGSGNEEDAWSIARNRQCAQLLVRLNKIKSDDLLLDQFKVEDGILPAWLQYNQLSPIDEYKVSYWDETHKKCEIGARGSREDKKKFVSFPLDKEGKLDLVNGKYTEAEEKKYVNVKYEQEVRLLLGVIKIRGNDGNSIGKRLPPFSYTSKVVVSIDDREKLRALTIKDVKQSTGQFWLMDTRDSAVYYRHDDISAVKGLGAAFKERFGAVGITTVQQLKDLSDDVIANYTKKNKLPANKVKSFRAEVVSKFVDEDSPAKFDHRTTENPFQSKYGDEWELYIDKKALVGKVCITALIDHMFHETAKIFPDQNDWWVVHDSLSLMTAASSRRYMDQKGFLKHWVLPEKEMYEDLPENSKVRKYWTNKLVGNNPKAMPLDNSLNNDVHTAVQSHCVLTQNKDNDDDEKFSMRTPAAGLKAYKRIWELQPPSHRIIHDINLTYTSLKQVLENKGALVLSEYTKKGSRVGDRLREKGGRRGGKRKQDSNEERIEKEQLKFVHPQAKSSVKLISNAAKLKIEKKQK